MAPGNWAPWFDFKKKLEVNKIDLETVNDIIWELSERGIITDKELWMVKLERDKNSYWLARKCANYIRNAGSEHLPV